MKSEWLGSSDLAFLGEISIVIFVAVFVGSIVWMFRPGSRERYQQRSQMPLDDHLPVNPRSASERA
ncbi:MAG: cbb3-type cytochrome c oxidase subunit 3 [Myxococcales bacterium FL481]|nr:MAG: cbb3-type cytochrome c oxidase subunit 3 [Myxococcales bacterium FL481]